MGKNGNREYLEKRSLKNTVFKGTGGAEKTEESGAGCKEFLCPSRDIYRSRVFHHVV